VRSIHQIILMIDVGSGILKITKTRFDMLDNETDLLVSPVIQSYPLRQIHSISVAHRVFYSVNAFPLSFMHLCLLIGIKNVSNSIEKICI